MHRMGKDGSSEMFSLVELSFLSSGIVFSNTVFLIRI